jgi:hypothetical protein
MQETVRQPEHIPADDLPPAPLHHVHKVQEQASAMATAGTRLHLLQCCRQQVYSYFVAGQTRSKHAPLLAKAGILLLSRSPQSKYTANTMYTVNTGHCRPKLFLCWWYITVLYKTVTLQNGY